MLPNSKSWTRKEENLSDWPKRRCWLSILQELIRQILWDTSLMHSISITNTLALGLSRDQNPWEAMIAILRISEKKASSTKAIYFPFEHFLTYRMRPYMKCCLASTMSARPSLASPLCPSSKTKNSKTNSSILCFISWKIHSAPNTSLIVFIGFPAVKTNWCGNKCP